jgi:hypothetical protein
MEGLDMADPWCLKGPYTYALAGTCIVASISLIAFVVAIMNWGGRNAVTETALVSACVATGVNLCLVVAAAYSLVTAAHRGVREARNPPCDR